MNHTLWYPGIAHVDKRSHIFPANQTHVHNPLSQQGANLISQHKTLWWPRPSTLLTVATTTAAATTILLFNSHYIGQRVLACSPS